MLLDISCVDIKELEHRCGITQWLTILGCQLVYCFTNYCSHCPTAQSRLYSIIFIYCSAGQCLLVCCVRCERCSLTRRSWWMSKSKTHSVVWSLRSSEIVCDSHRSCRGFPINRGWDRRSLEVFSGAPTCACSVIECRSALASTSIHPPTHTVLCTNKSRTVVKLTWLYESGNTPSIRIARFFLNY